MDWQKYQINYKDLNFKRCLGRGSQANVYEADLNGQKVAVKKFSVLQNLDVGVISRLNHKNIVRLLGVCVDQHCVVMEICQQSLYEILQSDVTVAFTDCLNWIKMITEGMEYLHSESVVHRDLKSPNVLLGLDGGIKICDFDLSKSSPTSTVVMMTLCGTLHWVAPEIIREEPYTRKIDVWSFGILAWEIVTQQTPYNGENNYPLKLSMSKIKLNFPIELHPRLLELFESCLEFDPVKRPEFSQIREKIRLVPKAEDQNWQTWKKTWKTMRFCSTTASFTQSENDTPVLKKEIPLGAEKSSSDQTISTQKNDTPRTTTQTSTKLNTVTPPPPPQKQSNKVGFMKANLQHLACNLANIQLNVANITAATNNGRSCRNRIHVLEQYDGKIQHCDICAKNTSEKLRHCAACQLICHSSCNEAIEDNICIPRSKKLIEVKNEEQFVKAALGDRLPHTQPQIFHHILHCIFEMEKRKLLFTWNKPSSMVLKSTYDDKRKAMDLIVKLYGQRVPPNFSQCNDSVLHAIIDRFWMPKLPSKQSDVFLKHVHAESITDIKHFIAQLESCRSATAALFFTHWILKGNHKELDESCISTVVSHWIGVEVTQSQLKKQLRTVMLAIEFDFWKQFLMCYQKAIHIKVDGSNRHIVVNHPKSSLHYLAISMTPRQPGDQWTELPPFGDIRAKHSQA